MQIKFNPLCTNVNSQGFLEGRVDLYIDDPLSKTYQQQYVYVPVLGDNKYPGKVGLMGSPLDPKDFQSWLDNLPHIWQLNPALCHFFTMPETVKLADLENYVNLIFTPDLVKTLDNIMVLPDSAHYASPLMRNKGKYGTPVQTLDKADLINSVNAILADVIVPIDTSGGKAFKIEPESTDIGPGATDRATSTAGEYTVAEAGNPANASDPLDTVEVWAATNISNFRFGTSYYTTGTYGYKIRASAVIGSVTAGSKQTFTGKSITCTTGDLATWYLPASSGTIEQAQSGGDGIYYTAGEYIDANDETSYTLLSGWADSVYATGAAGGATIYPVWHSIGSGLFTGIRTGVN